MAVVVYVLLCVLPAAVFELIAHGLNRWSTHDAPQRGRRWARLLHPFGGTRAGTGTRKPNCDRYRNDLRRLSATYDKLRTAEVPARALRLRAVEMAYVDTLRDACVAFELSEPPPEPDAATRLQIEAELLTAGLTW